MTKQFTYLIGRNHINSLGIAVSGMLALETKMAVIITRSAVISNGGYICS